MSEPKKVTPFFLYLLILAMPAGPANGEHPLGPNEERGSTARQHRVLPPAVTEQQEYYDLCGCCEKDLQCEMTEKAIRWKDGKKYDSVTSWKVKWDYAYNRSSHACFADNFRVTMNVVFRLPRWTCPEPVSQALVDKWTPYITNLVEHENGHRDLALTAAHDLTRAVAEMPPARTCSDLDAAVDAMSREWMKKLDEDQALFDAHTGHGFAQGVMFP
ncbi:MAG: hypothetical protein A2010_18265 [Nitrospirae bacterium GWD2_57_9]|nr:MAG: hypothetical protein A2010_18265 [Nitrospirae bacterium GWD2_57_9]